MPDTMSLTRVWLPNEMARPRTEAPAISGVMFTPKSSSAIMTAIRPMTIAIATRIRGIRVLMRDAGRYDADRGSLSAYLYGIARNHVLRKLEQDRPFVPFSDRSADAEEITPQAMIAKGDPLTELTRGEMIQALRDSILSMPPRYREVVVLCDLHEMSYVEAAAVIGCAVGTVRSRLHRARALLLVKLRAARDRNEDTQEGKPVRCFA